MNKYLTKISKKKYTWIITGGAGFIGSNLIERLLKNNQKVVCIDNLFSGDIKNIKIFLKNKKEIINLIKSKQFNNASHIAAFYCYINKF